MTRAHPSSVSLAGLIVRGFGRSERGATAIEFALVAPIFFAIIGAAMETALVFFAGQALDSGVHDTSRLIRTGQAQAMNLSQFRDAICDRLYGMFECGQIKVRVGPIDNFAGSSPSSPIDPVSGDWTIDDDFEPGSGGNIILVEAYYKWPTIITIPGLMTGVTGDGKRLLGAARVFRNEPFF